MPPPGKLPKPKWKELVAPYEGKQPGATIRNHIAHAPGWVWACRAACHCMKAIPLAPYIERYGLDITFDELRRRMRCTACGEHPGSFSLPTMGRNNEYRFPPAYAVPEAMRGYAMIDPLHLPAPLRGSQRGQIGPD